MKPPTKLAREPRFLASLIRTAYLPLELPPAITTRSFSDFCGAHYKILAPDCPALIKKSTTPETFSAPRPTGGRRTMALVHPVAQLGISLLITKHRERIRKTITKRGTSLYRTEEDIRGQKAFASLDFRRWDVERARICAECPVILTADISRFFYTVYTHSIPWAIIGKEKAKEYLANNKRALFAHWSSDFDTALQACQSRETFGIPVGPDTSRIIAELLMTGVESDSAFSAAIAGRPMARLLDDFIIGFEDEFSARKALSSLRQTLWKFNLQLNEEKTAIRSSRNVYLDPWKLDVAKLSIARRRLTDDVYHLVDRTLQLCEQAKTAAPASWACNRLNSVRQSSQSNFGILLDATLRLARDFPSCMHIAAAFVINHQDFCRLAEIKRRIEMWLKSTMRLNAQQGNDFEQAWCLVISGVLKIQLDEEDLPSRDTVPSGVVLAILGMLYERNLLKVPLSSWKWRAELKRSGIMGSSWLPYYEAVVRGWTTDKTMINAVKSQPILDKMLASKVSFLEDRIFDAAYIDLSHRTFRSLQAGQVSEISFLTPY